MPVADAFVECLDPELCVVTAEADGERAGCLVGFSSQCSIEPVRYVVWLSKANRTHRVAKEAGHLAVHLLGRDQYALARLFGGESGDRVDKFATVEWGRGPHGTVVLGTARAWLVGRVVGRFDGGDHVGFVLAPEAAGSGGGSELQQPFRLSDADDITPGHPVD
ncbi:flavin reductase family protein [Streptomyces sp. NPDC051684]|uniref:flavin reductase family protein n=1 Tax=Streptomyces sp. NPDC051684 TaxID=3365670 RepID=UPI0037A6F92A